MEPRSDVLEQVQRMVKTAQRIITTDYHPSKAYAQRNVWGGGDEGPQAPCSWTICQADKHTHPYQPSSTLAT